MHIVGVGRAQGERSFMPGRAAPCGPRAPLSSLFPLPFHFLIFCFFYFSPFPFLIRFTHFLLLSIPSLFSTRVVPLHFQAGGRRKQPNLGLVTFCVSRRRRKMYCGHARLCLSVCVCVCLTVRGRTPLLLHGPGCNLGAW